MAPQAFICRHLYMIALLFLLIGESNLSPCFYIMLLQCISDSLSLSLNTRSFRYLINLSASRLYDYLSVFRFWNVWSIKPI
jgi:hypothetical protein